MTINDQQLPHRILVAGGGTGGHVYPALAIIEALRLLHPVEIRYIGGQGGIETRIVPSRGIIMETLWISGIIRGFALKNLLFPFKLLSSLFRSYSIIRRFRPDIAVGTGGYVSGPPLYIAALLRIPVLIQEQDVYPGITTRLLARKADKICIPYQAAREHFPGKDEHLIVTGNPVRQGLTGFSREEALRRYDLKDERLTVFVFGGSQGARSINTAMADLVDWLVNDKQCQILWQTGDKLYNEVTAAVGQRKNVVVKAYIEDMGTAYAASDIIVCRAGAGSLTELAIVAKPAILIPYPYAAGNHQERNSMLIEKEGAAVMIAEKGDWQPQLKQELQLLIDDPQQREEKRNNWKKLAREDAAQTIATEILKLVDRQ